MAAPVGDAFDGRGQQHGRLRPDWGPDYAELQCDRCRASWVGPDGEPCPWCAGAHRRLLEQQAQLLLRAPDVELDDVRRPPAMSAWAERLARAVAAGIIDERRALTALERHHGR